MVRQTSKKKPLRRKKSATLDKFHGEFRVFRKENDKRWVANEKRWDENDKRWVANEKRWDENEKRWVELGVWRDQTDRSLTLIATTVATHSTILAGIQKTLVRIENAHDDFHQRFVLMENSIGQILTIINEGLSEKQKQQQTALVSHDKTLDHHEKVIVNHENRIQKIETTN